MVFFPPKLWSWQWGETEYGLGSLPLGGFVEIEGMGEETAANTEEVAPGDFRTKPAWQRGLVMAGGILFNLLSAFLLIACLLLANGTTYLGKEGLNEHGIAPTPLGEEVGFMRGDKILAVNGEDFDDTEKLRKAIYRTPAPASYTISRNGQQQEVRLTAEMQLKLQQERQKLWEPLAPFKIKKIQAGSAAEKAGLQPEDRIVSIDGKATPYMQDLHQALKARGEQKVTIAYERGAQNLTTEAILSKEAKLGIETAHTLKFSRKRYSIASALAHAGIFVVEIGSSQVQGIFKVVTRQVPFFKSMQSPIAIAGMFGEYEGFSGFLWLIAFLSIILALMNLLPIPALDGFHLVINLGEVITRKKISPSSYARIQTLGALLLFSLMCLLVLKDLYKMFSG